MAATQDWDNFSAFAGEARLDKSYMENATDKVGHDDVMKFYRWIKALSDDAHPVPGILPAYVTSVQRLLGAFFPSTWVGDNWLPAVRIKTQDDGRVAVASLVDFGNAVPQQQMQIVDGPTALGYIFSVAIPPANPTLLNYYLPLEALYTRFLYLAFLYDKVAGTQELVSAVGDIPQMSCVMYTVGANATVRYIYGATPAFIPSADLSRGAERENALSTLNNYRLNTVLRPALAQEVPNAQIPGHSPRHIEALAGGLWAALSKTRELSPKPANRKTRDSIIAPAAVIQDRAIREYKALPQYQNVKLVALDWSDVSGHATLGGDLMTNLQIIVRDGLSNNYNRNSLSPATVNSWRNIVRIYVTPHIHTDIAFTNVIDHPPVQGLVNTEVDMLMNNVWERLEPRLLDELDKLLNEGHNRQDHTPFGRCAETYCISGMLRQYFPLETINNVRGISLAVSRVGGSNAFQDGFNTRTLGAAAGKNANGTNRTGVYRLPCINCQELLPLFHVNMNQYNTDIYTIPDRINGDPH
ncbi:hypothetical protein F4803DRAFT_98815 [Xylaria telfairii]|nr:hypothetical protein F4803DRAFT_98815 [Xylaria telfairii]